MSRLFSGEASFCERLTAILGVITADEHDVAGRALATLRATLEKDHLGTPTG
jgi:hypothetical protein